MNSESEDVDSPITFDYFSNDKRGKKTEIRKMPLHAASPHKEKAGMFSSSSATQRKPKSAGQFYNVPTGGVGGKASQHESLGDSFRDSVLNGNGTDKEKDDQNMSMALDKYSKAIAETGTGNKHMPQLATKHANACIWLEKNELAQETLSKVIQQFPHNYSLYLTRGKTYLQMKQLENAIADFTEAVDKEAGNTDANNISAFGMRAESYYQQKNWRAALEDFDRVSSVHSAQTRPEIYFKRGMCHSSIKNYSLAVTDLKDVRMALDDRAVIQQAAAGGIGRRRLRRGGKEPPVNEDDVIVELAKAYKEMGENDIALATCVDLPPSSQMALSLPSVAEIA